jgi:cell division protein FtsB
MTLELWNLIGIAILLFSMNLWLSYHCWRLKVLLDHSQATLKIVVNKLDEMTQTSLILKHNVDTATDLAEFWRYLFWLMVKFNIGDKS